MELGHSKSLVCAGTLLPVFVCVGVGLFHLPLALNNDFSVHGGGLFGMFSTLDSRIHRHVTVNVHSEDQKVLLDLDAHKAAVDALLAYPSAARMRDFAAYLVCLKQPEVAGDGITLTYQKDDLADPQHVPEVHAFDLDILCGG